MISGADERMRAPPDTHKGCHYISGFPATPSSLDIGEGWELDLWVSVFF